MGEGDNAAGEGVCEPCENGFYSNGGTTCHYCGDNTDSFGEIVARSREDCSKTYVSFFTLTVEACPQSGKYSGNITIAYKCMKTLYIVYIVI